MHVGRLHPLAFIKNAGLPENHPECKYKGRIVFLESQVGDEYGAQALFNEVSSAPVAMEAFHSVDAYGLLNNQIIETIDAKQAYIQSDLKGKETWVRPTPPPTISASLETLW
mgnify:CR=1 FL=1